MTTPTTIPTPIEARSITTTSRSPIGNAANHSVVHSPPIQPFPSPSAQAPLPTEARSSISTSRRPTSNVVSNGNSSSSTPPSLSSALPNNSTNPVLSNPILTTPLKELTIEEKAKRTIIINGLKPEEKAELRAKQSKESAKRSYRKKRNANQKPKRGIRK